MHPYIKEVVSGITPAETSGAASCIFFLKHPKSKEAAYAHLLIEHNN